MTANKTPTKWQFFKHWLINYAVGMDIFFIIISLPTIVFILLPTFEAQDGFKGFTLIIKILASMTIAFFFINSLRNLYDSWKWYLYDMNQIQPKEPKISAL